MVLAARGWRPITIISENSTLVSTNDAYIDANSPTVVKIDNVPIHTMMKPYTSPAEPPLHGVC